MMLLLLAAPLLVWSIISMDNRKELILLPFKNKICYSTHARLAKLVSAEMDMLQMQ
jgi:hypothetical protein